MSNKGFEMWGFVASILGTIFLVPLLYAWLTGELPSAKMRHLETILSETETLLRSALEEGTIELSYYDRKYHDRMWRTKCSTDELRAEVYNIKDGWHEVRCWLDGLSGRISDAIDALNDVRGGIAISSSRGRQQLTEMGCTANPTLAVYSRGRNISSHTTLAAPPPSVTTELQPHRLAGMDSVLGQDGLVSPLGYTQLAVPACQHLPATGAYGATEHTNRIVPFATDTKPTPLPPVRFASGAIKTRMTIKRRSMRDILLSGLGKKLTVDAIDVRCTPPAAPIMSPPKLHNNNTSRLHAIASYFGRMEPSLPRDTGSIKSSVSRSASEMASGDVLNWRERVV